MGVVRMRGKTRKENTLAWGWGWVDVLWTATTRRRIMEISSRERGGTRSRTCYSTATKPRIGKSTKRLSRNSVRRISLVGKHKKAQSGGGFGVVLSSPDLSGAGFFSTSQLPLRLPEESRSTYSRQPSRFPSYVKAALFCSFGS